MKILMMGMLALALTTSAKASEENSLRTIVREYIVGHNDFSRIDSGMAYTEGEPTTYYNKKTGVVSERYIDYITDLFIDVPKEFTDDPVLAAKLTLVQVAHADPESGFRVWAVGDSGNSRNLLQINGAGGHKKYFYVVKDGVVKAGSHAKKMSYNGQTLSLYWNNDRDMMVYPTVRLLQRLDSGLSLYSACGWWTVRDKKGAWNIYIRLQEKYNDSIK